MKRILMVFIIGMVFIVAGVAQVASMQWGNANWYESDSLDMSASHAELPFGTRVRVTNLENNKRVIVTITNRIPLDERLLLSIASGAAQGLEMMEDYMTPVIVEVIRNRRSKSSSEERNPLSPAKIPEGFILR